MIIAIPKTVRAEIRHQEHQSLSTRHWIYTRIKEKIAAMKTENSKNLCHHKTGSILRNIRTESRETAI